MIARRQRSFLKLLLLPRREDGPGESGKRERERERERKGGGRKDAELD